MKHRLNYTRVRKPIHGFTLIELLVVIAIIALLLSIILPSLKMAKEKGRAVVCSSSLKGVGVGVSAYLIENDGVFHKGKNNGMWNNWVDGSGDELEYDHWLAYWGIAYSQYTSGRDAFECPSVKVGDMDVWILPGEQFSGRSQSEVFPYFKNCAYGLNGYTNSYGDTKVKVLSFRSPSTTIFAQDHIEQKLDSTNSDMFCIGSNVSINLTQWRGYASYYPEAVQGCFRHSRKGGKNGVSNTLWLDGHVDPIRETTGEDVPVSWYVGKTPR